MAFAQYGFDNNLNENLLQKNNEIICPSLKVIINNQQSLILDLQEKMEFVLPKMENEIVRLSGLNQILSEKCSLQEIEIRKIKQKNYQAYKFAEGNNCEILRKIMTLEHEMQRIDNLFEVLKFQLIKNPEITSTISYSDVSNTFDF